MPYIGQAASKISHSSFFEAELEKFLSHCNYLKTLTPEEHALAAAHKVHIEPTPMTRNWLWSSDGSRYVASVQDGAPTTRIGYIKVSQVGFTWSEYVNLLPINKRFVDPFAVAKLRDAIKSVMWMLPGSNIKYKNADTAYESFRLRLHELFLSTQLNDTTTLYDTLFLLRSSSQRRKEDTPGTLYIQECPQCHHKHDNGGICFHPTDNGLPCAHCGKNIYASDVLGFHLEFEEHGANEGLFTRVMSALELFLLAHRLYSGRTEPSSISNSIFFYDGLLGMYGDCSWLCRGVLCLYHELRRDLIKLQLSPPLIVGIAKTGQLMKHAESILSDLGSNDVLPLSLSYRRTVLHQSVDDPRRPFFTSKWGQEFIWRTSAGQPVVLSIPYWTTDLESNRENIHKVENYPSLAEIIGALNSMDCALYPSSFIPVVIAHEEASISWEPGGRLLTEATKRALGAGNAAD
jgi:hypothetical protein